MTDSITSDAGRLTAPWHEEQQNQLLQGLLADASSWHRLRGRDCPECAGLPGAQCGSCTADELAIYLFAHLANRPGGMRPAFPPGELLRGKREIIADAAAKARAYRHGRCSPIDQALAAAYQVLAEQLGWPAAS
jgi:hypothetical protein